MPTCSPATGKLFVRTDFAYERSDNVAPALRNRDRTLWNTWAEYSLGPVTVAAEYDRMDEISGVLAGLFASSLPGYVSNPSLSKDMANSSWFIGVLVGGLAYRALAGTRRPESVRTEPNASAKAFR